jgi:hypothetical protein
VKRQSALKEIFSRTGASVGVFAADVEIDPTNAAQDKRTNSTDVIRFILFIVASLTGEVTFE